MTAFDGQGGLPSAATVITLQPRAAKMNRQQSRNFDCSVCGKSFKRREHCSRHERAHTRTKPFVCPFCGRSYSRRDLVTRHKQSFHPTGNAEHKEVISIPSGPGLENPLHEGDSAITELPNHGSITEETDLGQLHAREQSVQHVTSDGHTSSEVSNSVTEETPPNGHGTSDVTPRIQSYDRNSISGTFSEFNYMTIPPDHGGLITEQSPRNAPQAIRGLSWEATDNLMQNEAGNQLHPNAENDQSQLGLLSRISDDASNIDTQFSISASQYLFDTDGILQRSGTHPPWENLYDWAFQTPYIPDGASPLQPLGSSYSESNHSSQPDNEKAVGAGSALINDSIYDILQQSIRNYLPPSQQFTLPSMSKLQQFMKSYMSCFHGHFPIIHSPSLHRDSIYAPLYLSVLAIGALYRLNRTMARHLWTAAKVLLEPDCKRTGLMTQIPIQVIQAKLLTTMFAVFGNNTSDIVAVTGSIGFWEMEYRSRRASLTSLKNQASSLSWNEWISRESTKRLLCGIFILSSLLTITYGTNSFVSITADLNIEIPEPEMKWKAANAQEWEQLNTTHPTLQLPTVRDGMTLLIFNRYPQSYEALLQNRHALSEFGTTIVMHAVIVNMWHVMQCTQSFTAFPLDEGTNGHEMVMEVEQGLNRCYALLTAHQSEKDQINDFSESPHIFTCLALLRSAYVRLFAGVDSFDRLMLLVEDEAEIIHTMQNYVRAPQMRNAFLTKAVSKAFGGLLTPIAAGYLLVKKTAALTWSMEHAVAAWDCALFVTKWIHSLETRQSTSSDPLAATESQNLSEIRHLLSEVESDHSSESESLAANIASVWADFLDDTWVWGVTPRMAHLLRLLSTVYAAEWKDKVGSTR